MKVTIIGGSGFVGTRLITELLQREEITVLNIDKNPSEHYPAITEIANVLDKDALQRLLIGTDVVVLLAAEHRDDVSPVSLYYDVNVKGTQLVLEAMEANAVKHIVFTSSVAVYGLDKENPDESAAIDPFNHYGKSKWQAEEVLQKWNASHADWIMQVVRPTVIFGEGNRGNVYNLLNQIASGKFMMIGKGENRKSMAYVGNVVAFIQFLLENKTMGSTVYNYVDKPDFTTNDLVRHTGEALGKTLSARRIPYWLGMLGGYGFDVLAAITRKKLAISSVRVKKFCAETQYDSTKAMQSGFQPPFPMEEGLRRTLHAEFGKS
ncbi:NAD-dependent epimerase/dehydratase family protein [Sphingobacterium oryzagri]|uniref:NAD-dependent epimerase/dehydratase family protein n=1 Tax=Sphingobacterium oryzagri TaxID=3025669 RepID=A0ABY7WFG3_9SPHI|nr:NAD-dependent epimerase/dehydratase family protein [Sphingobacterium sp. KACC 22765]WDF68361.1 NAD-dependent epimerase/dehydratase family protein [Sphingobacterium sp. KACC 22765]